MRPIRRGDVAASRAAQPSRAVAGLARKERRAATGRLEPVTGAGALAPFSGLAVNERSAVDAPACRASAQGDSRHGRARRRDGRSSGWLSACLLVSDAERAPRRSAGGVRTDALFELARMRELAGDRDDALVPGGRWEKPGRRSRISKPPGTSDTNAHRSPDLRRFDLVDVAGVCIRCSGRRCHGFTTSAALANASLTLEATKGSPHLYP